MSSSDIFELKLTMSVTLIGAAAFLIFAVLYVAEAWYDPMDEIPAMVMR